MTGYEFSHSEGYTKDMDGVVLCFDCGEEVKPGEGVEVEVTTRWDDYIFFATVHVVCNEVSE